MIEQDGVIRVQDLGYTSAQAVLTEIEKRTATPMIQKDSESA
jgi:hypothetical protein